MNKTAKFSRRQFNTGISAAVATNYMTRPTLADEPSPTDFQLTYLLASCLYGHIYFGDILPEVAKTGATAIDLWSRPHGSQREQLDAIGEETMIEMLAEHQLTIGCMTRFDLSGVALNGVDRQELLRDELRLAGRLNCKTLVTGALGPKGLKGNELKSAIKSFVEQQKPTLEVAENNGARLAIENHGNSLIDSPDSLQWLAEFSSSTSLAIAFAPYHLPQDTKLLSNLIRSLGPAIALFYGWEHGMGCMTRMPKEEELMQLPGRGTLDFKPLLAALKAIRFEGWTEIFMHPVPRGIPILETEALVTNEIKDRKIYLDNLLKEI
jgi:sugar phosphate isomerase/epimerase